jgi:hypothetical protein
MLHRLGYSFFIPPLLTAVASVLLAVVGATLVAAAKQRKAAYNSLLRATLVASIPGLLLFGYLSYALVNYLIRAPAT